MEIAQAGNCRASKSLRSVSTIPLRSDPFEKVPSWLSQIEVDNKLTKNGKEVSRIALASKLIQRLSGALPQTRKLFQPAGKMIQPTVSNVGNSGNLFVPKVAPVTLKSAAPHYVQFGNSLPPNQPTTNHKMGNDTVRPHVASAVSLTAHPQSHFGPTRVGNMGLPASLPKLKLHYSQVTHWNGLSVEGCSFQLSTLQISTPIWRCITSRRCSLGKQKTH